MLLLQTDSSAREYFRSSSFGGLVPMGDAAAMAESLAATYDTAALRAQAQDFSIDKAIDRYLELLLPQASSGGGGA